MEISTSYNLPRPPLSPKQTQSRDPKNWNSIIRTHTKLKNDQAVLNSHTQMENLHIFPDQLTLPLILKACARLQAVERGKRIHSDIQNMPMVEDVRVRTALIDFYNKCGLTEEARKVFDETTEKDVVCWNAMIGGYSGNSRYKDAILLFYQMQSGDLRPSSVTLVSLLLICGELLELKLGQEIHSYCLRRGMFDLDAHMGTALISFYSRFDLNISRLVFDSMLIKNDVSWNAVISGYFSVGDSLEALRFFVKMINDGIIPNSIALLVAVQSCIYCQSLEWGKQIHQLIIKSGQSHDLFIVNALIDMYGKNEKMEYSTRLFETITKRDVAMWNTMMSMYKECQSFDEAFALFGRMRLEGVRENATTIAILLSACGESVKDLGKGEVLHAHVIKSGMDINVYLGNAMLSMYARLNSVESAQKVFNGMNNRDVVSWNTLMSVLTCSKSMNQLRDFFAKMQRSDIQPNSFTMVAVLAACEDETCLNIGRSIHGYVIRRGLEFNSSLCTALTNMYMACGNEKIARHLFESFSDRDLISWNALITCYVEKNRHNEALLLFHRMLGEVEPNTVTIINILSSCANVANLLQSRCVHAYAIRREFALDSNISVGNALITMYARCGSMGNAEKVFRSLSSRDIITWNAIIAAYGMHGHGEEALLVFSQMQEDDLIPTNVTFVSVLSACSHAGLIEEGWKHFNSMTRDYSIPPEVVHYACMVDLLGRGGQLNEARDFIKSMPIEPDASVWRALLGACRVYSEVEQARTAFGKLVQLEPMNVGNYILLSNIYASEGLWKEVRKLRAELEKKKLTKPPGNSWIVVRNQVHRFTAGDKSHPHSKKIYTKLSCLVNLIMEHGYVPDRRWVLKDVEDEKKDESLLCHSEKLAIAFGLLNMTGGAPILVNKNLRVCGDCHNFSKYISKFVGREIVLRDTSRFHHFVNGVCSCKDYWISGLNGSNVEKGAIPGPWVSSIGSSDGEEVHQVMYSRLAKIVFDPQLSKF